MRRDREWEGERETESEKAGYRRADRICPQVSQRQTQTEEAAGVRVCVCV